MPRIRGFPKLKKRRRRSRTVRQEDQYTIERTLQSGEVVFEKGDPSDYAYVIEEGQVEILREVLGRHIRLALLGKGEIFGEMGLVDERPRSLTARAMEQTRLSSVTRDELVDMIFQRPQEGLKYLSRLFERLRAMNTRVGLAEEVSEEALGEPYSAKVTLAGVTEKAQEVLPPGGLVIERFPFRIGRESKSSERGDLEVNELALPDDIPYHVSRNHVAIDRTSTHIVIRDRGSFLGTLVNEVVVGGQQANAEAQLNEGVNQIALGRDDSPFRFQIVVVPEPTATS